MVETIIITLHAQNGEDKQYTVVKYLWHKLADDYSRLVRDNKGSEAMELMLTQATRGDNHITPEYLKSEECNAEDMDALFLYIEGLYGLLPEDDDWQDLNKAEIEEKSKQLRSEHIDMLKKKITD